MDYNDLWLASVTQLHPVTTNTKTNPHCTGPGTAQKHRILAYKFEHVHWRLSSAWDITEHVHSMKTIVGINHKVRYG